ncbi:HlyD family type I secretion periplasmic adaptor subunit [Zavarzinia compransoris]|uniref:Membrane fusion protein (MFP) family protein n=1 Tax=Zavarzinia compransoris TaxID=1264899 RepID=A0A317DXR7_9PROT|nr:HlyD family type I secretion periplasmic adaptor subunit [Zavarzinia compransoris]PWR17615.1 HlyD family type I secretion periplasmic adaptor subunit [Zavarzinia compransoris]TDP44110.1 HlyD family secretion protein [Zavarzinia compransoris]
MIARLAAAAVRLRDRLVQAFETLAPEPPPALAYGTPAARLEHQGPHGLLIAVWWGLIGLLFVTLLWSFVARLDVVVGATGRIVTTTPLIVVQPLETAIVHDIAVEAGERVRRGQVLATLDATFTAADVQRLSRQKAALEARLARLTAEFQETPFVPEGGDPTGAVAIEQAIHDRWQAERLARIAAFDGQEAQLKAAIETRRRDETVLREHLSVQQEIERMYAKLAENQHGSRLLRLQAQSERLTIERQLTLSVNEVAELLFRQEGLAAERDAYMAGQRQQLGEALAAARRELDAVVEELSKAERRNALVSLTAPADAVVLEIAHRSVGSVIQAAEPLFTLVPTGVPLEAEVWIDPADVGRLRLGDGARIKLDAYPFQRHGVARGTLRMVSSDAVTRPDAPAGAGTYYRALIDVDTETMRGLPGADPLRPGMTGTAEILVGDRRLIDYILDPILKGLDEGLREP